MHRRTGAVLAAAVLTALSVVPAAAPAQAEPGWRQVPAAAAPVSNPLKGLLPFAPQPGEQPSFSPDAPPYTMEWIYLPLDRVVTGPGQYDWSLLESSLDAVAARGHQSALRFYVDFPGRDSGLPDYLTDRNLVKVRHYTAHGNKTSVSPDYDDPDLMAMLTGFIKAVGARYDKDPRIGYITQGLVGFWGESHTWPYDGSVSEQNPNGENWMPTRENQAALVAAWDRAFNTTPTQVRYPSAASRAHAVGYHDDSFSYSTLPQQDWHFWSLMTAQGTTESWRTQPTGGEIYPPIQSCVFDVPQRCQQAVGVPAQDIDQAVATTHVTWLISHRSFESGLTGAARDHALRVSSRMGYTLAVPRWRYERASGRLEIEVASTGVAPFPYDWELEAVAVDSRGATIGSARLDGDLRQAAPGGRTLLTGTLTTPPQATATILFRAVNPLPTGVPLRFASAGQDTTRPGYLTLGQAPAR